ncbi:MAG: long-chain fatty acid--CoA ligase [Betaproteobacteria bacterium]|nr:long-chain fatty acid--CoA ligase [Betaproteobacteria bacterium]
MSIRPTLFFRGETVPPDVFEQRWRRSAAALQSAGVGDGDVVALMMHNCPEAIELMVAVRHLGAQWCPINWHFRSDEVSYILRNSAARVFIADDALLHGLTGLDTAGATVFAIRGGDGAGDKPSSGTAWPLWEVRRDACDPLGDLAVRPRGAMFYTSGTTGLPKGIVRAPMTAAQLQASVQVRRLAYGIEPGMRALLSAPWYHSAPNSYALGIAMEDGTLFIEERFDAERTLAMIETHALTHAYLVPTMYVRLLALPPAVRQRYDLRSMKFVSSTGSPCPPEVKRAMIEWWGPVIHECYGSSELGYMTFLDSEQALRKPGSAGLPLPGVVLRILDEQGTELPRNTPGLIYIDQPAMPDFSYVGNAAARERMEVGGLKTMGDVGYLDDEGFLFIVDRKADMVISGGVNIYPVEIENVLLGMPGVADCAVFGIPDDEFGEALAAVVQPVAGAGLQAEAVRAWLRERLAGYKVPRVVQFHAQLPREETGKIFKRKLREPFWAGRERRV